MLSIEELAELEDAVMEVLPDKITQILSRANINGKLEELLKLLELSDLIGGEKQYDTYKDGKIVVIGGTEV